MHYNKINKRNPRELLFPLYQNAEIGNLDFSTQNVDYFIQKPTRANKPYAKENPVIARQYYPARAKPRFLTRTME